MLPARIVVGIQVFEAQWTGAGYLADVFAGLCPVEGVSPGRTAFGSRMATRSATQSVPPTVTVSMLPRVV